MKPKRSGFTLIELMVAIVIVSIIALIGLVLYSETQKNARDAKRKSDIQAISNALEAHYNYSTGYPAISTSWFVNNETPKDPQHTVKDYIWVTQPSSSFSYKVCADLEADGVRGTTDTDPNDFCREQQL